MENEKCKLNNMGEKNIFLFVTLGLKKIAAAIKIRLAENASNVAGFFFKL